MSKSLVEENRELKQQIKALKDQVNKLTAIIKLQQNQMFGKKTEVIESVVDGQQSLFSDDELAQLQDSNVSITEVIEKQKKQVVRHRKAKVSGQRTAFLDRLPQVDKTIHLTNEDCPKCHEQMKKIGNHLYSREVRLKPAELYCVNLYQESYKCNDCDEDGKDMIISSQMPQSLLPHSYVSSSVLAKVAEYKFALALPFHRQVKLWQAVGLPVSGRQLVTNIITVSQTYLKPLYERLTQLMQGENVIQMDETPFKVIDEAKNTSYFWATKTKSEFSHHQMVIFHYRNTRSGKVIGDIIGQGYPGFIMCDGYGGYSNRLYPNARFGSCLVHIRREFIRITKLLSKKQLKYSKAFHAIKLLGAVFHKENELVYQTEKEKRQQRITHVKPLLDRFYQYLGSFTSPQGRLCAAIKNTLRLRTRVYRILENGQIPLSNNSLEGEIRLTTLVRKNCLFAKSIRGAEANAIYYTLVATAKINKLNVYKYFKYLFDRLPNQKRIDIEAFLPWAEEVQQVCHN